MLLLLEEQPPLLMPFPQKQNKTLFHRVSSIGAKEKEEEGKFDLD